MKELKAHQQERVPATPPIEGVVNAKTVLADKGRFAAPKGAHRWRLAWAEARHLVEQLT